MAFDLATAFLQLETRGSGMLGAARSLADTLHGAAQASGGLPRQPTAAQRRGMPHSMTSLSGLAARMQQEAVRQDLDRQTLAAQQAANEHLEILAACAGGNAMRVQVVGSQTGQW